MELELYDIKENLTRELLTKEENLDSLLSKIDNLGTLVFDFSSEAKAKEAKTLKTQANKFVKQLKEFCEPLEAEGKKIADARSRIATRLITGKDNVIDKILQPLNEAEEQIKSIKAKINTPLEDLHSVSIRLAECDSLEKFNWLYLEEEALKLVKQLRGLALVAKSELEEKEKLKKEKEEKERLEREEKIRIETENRVKKEAEEKIKLAEKRAVEAEKEAQRKIDAQKEVEEKEKAQRENDKNHRITINNEILKDFEDFGISADIAKAVVIAIAKGQIRHIKINY